MTTAKRALRTDSLEELKSANTTALLVQRGAMERQAQFSQLWQEAHPNLKEQSIKLEQLSLGAKIFAVDVKRMAAEFMAAADVFLEMAKTLEETSDGVRESVMKLIQAEEEPPAILEDIEESVQMLIGQTMRLARLATGPQIDAGYVRSIITWAAPDTVDEALDGMLPGQLKYLAEKIVPRLKG